MKPNKVKKTNRYIESLVSGEFQKVSINFDPNAISDAELSKMKDKNNDGIVSTQEIIDAEMKEQ